MQDHYPVFRSQNPEEKLLQVIRSSITGNNYSDSDSDIEMNSDLQAISENIVFIENLLNIFISPQA